MAAAPAAPAQIWLMFSNTTAPAVSTNTGAWLMGVAATSRCGLSTVTSVWTSMAAAPAAPAQIWLMFSNTTAPAVSTNTGAWLMGVAATSRCGLSTVTSVWTSMAAAPAAPAQIWLMFSNTTAPAVSTNTGAWLMGVAATSRCGLSTVTSVWTSMAAAPAAPAQIWLMFSNTTAPAVSTNTGAWLMGVAATSRCGLSTVTSVWTSMAAAPAAPAQIWLMFSNTTAPAVSTNTGAWLMWVAATSSCGLSTVTSVWTSMAAAPAAPAQIWLMFSNTTAPAVSTNTGAWLPPRF